MSHVDLHVHSAFSDGLKTPEQLCAMAGRLEIEWIGLCDHDTVDGLDEMARAVGAENRRRAPRGLAPLGLVPGVEVSTGPGGRTHVLAYGAGTPSAALRAFLARIAADRRGRAVRMLERLEREGVPVTPQMRALPDAPSVGRAHFARALVQAGAARSVPQAFERYLAQGRPVYVPRRELDTGDTVAALSAMGLVTVLAHPMRLGLEDAALRAQVLAWKERGLAGLEAYHPSAGRRGARMLEAMARTLGLLVTGGSDYHGDAGAHARMGRLPSGWRSSGEDLRALLDAAGRAAAAHHSQKEQQDV